MQAVMKQVHAYVLTMKLSLWYFVLLLVTDDKVELDQRSMKEGLVTIKGKLNLLK